MSDWSTVQQLLRLVMQIIAGSLVAGGYITASMAATLTGSVVSLAGIAWWVFWWRKQPGAEPPAA